MRPLLRPRTWLRYEELGRIHMLAVLGRVRLANWVPRGWSTAYACLVELLEDTR
jgi:hypothetical protein